MSVNINFQRDFSSVGNQVAIEVHVGLKIRIKQDES